ncbi:MAG: hypothetical protein LUC35_08155 [Clostridiales bacterium]|nr:hypothetical protein [Clostridiales bacterium]
MIHMHVSAVFQVRDGFTGKIVEGNQLRCALDGGRIRPLVKPGGYLVLVDLPEGRHRLTLQSVGFREEPVDFTASRQGCWEGYLALKPAEGYAFRQAVTRVSLTLKKGQTPMAGQSLWLTSPGAPDCKVAQAAAEAGCTELRLYCKTPGHLPLPGTVLIDDGGDSEVVTLLGLTGETGQLASPLRRSHSRSRRLLPAQQYRTDDSGRISAVFPAAGELLVYAEGAGEAKRLNLVDGNNDFMVSFKET